MILTIEILKKINACNRAISMFYNSKELHGIDISKISEITVSDANLCNDIRCLQSKLKNHFKLRKLTFKNSNGAIREQVYNERGIEIEYKNSNGSCYKRIVDENGNELKLEHSTGETIERFYDKNGNETLTKYSSNTEIKRIYDFNGNCITVEIQPRNLIKNYTYDENNRKLTYEDTEGCFTRYVYYDYGYSVAVEHYGVFQYEYVYNYDDEVVKFTNSDGTSYENSYNTNGDLLIYKDSSGRFREYIYNENGLLIEIKENGKTVSAYTLNDDGYYANSIDADGKINNFIYDLTSFEYK